MAILRWAILESLALLAAADVGNAYTAITTKDGQLRCDGTSTSWGIDGYVVPGSINDNDGCVEACEGQSECKYVHWDTNEQECHLYQACSAVRACSNTCGSTYQKQSKTTLWEKAEQQLERQGLERAIEVQQLDISHVLNTVSDEMQHIASRAAADKAALVGSEKGVQQVVDNANSVESNVLANNGSLAEMSSEYEGLVRRAAAAVQLLHAFSTRETAVNRTRETVTDVLKRIDTSERTLNLLRPQMQRLGHHLRGLEGSLRHRSLRGVIAEESDKMMLRLYKDMTFALSEPEA
mmetsp:Transcript_45643/g.105953  ORF Transcript_45643/g.105953 Transcript_45643/m.105953 type:complete len:294 (-) Transcript_45643:14-895(-)